MYKGNNKEPHLHSVDMFSKDDRIRIGQKELQLRGLEERLAKTDDEMVKANIIKQIDTITAEFTKENVEREMAGNFADNLPGQKTTNPLKEAGEEEIVSAIDTLGDRKAA